VGAALEAQPPYAYYLSIHAPVTPATPTDIQQCKDGGWVAFGFANQGPRVASEAAASRGGR
jgi:hypothetical protein